jgi:hypothetical protein
MFAPVRVTVLTGRRLDARAHRDGLPEGEVLRLGPGGDAGIHLLDMDISDSLRIFPY